MTKERLLSADFVEDIFLEEDPAARQEQIAKYQTIAKGLGCKGQFDAMVKAQKQAIREDRKRQEEEAKKNPLSVVTNTYTVETDNDDIEEYQTGKWTVTENGIVAQDGKTLSVASYYPIIITKTLTDRDTSDEKIELAWKKNHVRRSITALRNVTSSSSKIVELSRYGFPVTTETAKELIRFLSDFEALNNITPMISSSKCGWADDEFIPYTDKIFFDGNTGFKSLTESICEHGSYEKWMDLVLDIRASGRKEPVVYLAASFGSVLLHLINFPPCIVNLYGTTGSGKTVSLMLAASVWANPSERGYISESNSTINALEQKLDVLNHLPLMIDDLSKIRGRDKERLADIIYGLCAGGGKNRLDRDVKMRHTATWDDVILSNMERPLVDDQMRAGAMNRVLDFEIEPGDIYKDGNKIVTVLSENYGFAGQRFLEVVKEVGRQKIREMVNHYRAMIREEGLLQGDEREEKQIVPLAILMTADKLTEEYIFRDGVRMDLDYCMQSVKSKRQVSEMERAYKHFVDAFHINRQKFDQNTVGEVWGKMQGMCVAVIPSALDRIAEQYNFNVAQFVKWCKTNDLLECDSDRNTKKISFDGSADRIRCYVIRIDDDVREYDDGFIKGETEDAEPLPWDMKGYRDGKVDDI